MKNKNWFRKSTREITEQDLKAGLVVIANWNSAKSIIVEIKDGFVHYRCPTFRPDTIYADKIEVKDVFGLFRT